MHKPLYIASRIGLVISIIILLPPFTSTFRFVTNPRLFGYLTILSAIIFPFAVLGVLFTTPVVNHAVKVLKWLIGITSAITTTNLVFILSLALTPKVGEGEAMMAVILFSVIDGGAFVLMLIELIALAIAQRFPKANATTDT
jgi:hypothetical protein